MADYKVLVEDTGPQVFVEDLLTKVIITEPDDEEEITVILEPIEYSVGVIEETILIAYIAEQGPPGPRGLSYFDVAVDSEIPTGSINGENRDFELANEYAPGTVKLMVNGLREVLGWSYFEIGDRAIRIDEAPEVGDSLLVDYQKLIEEA